MTYTLFGSRTSPFVRRTRILLENTSYEFKEIDIFGTDKEILKNINPINQIPVLVHGDQKIWDSRIIFNYLNQIHHFQQMSWDDENLLSEIDGAINSAVALTLMRRSGMNLEDPIMYVTRQKDRIESILDHLSPYIKNEAPLKWNIHSISLYCFLDWATFRGLIDISKRPECLNLLETYAHKQIVKETELPKV